MKECITLSSKERDFVTLVKSAAFSNPFSSKREQIDYKIAKLEMRASDDPEEILAILIDQVRKFLRKYDDNAPVCVTDFARRDQEPMKYVFLFLIFHELASRFDKLIQDQLKTYTNLKVKFHDHARQLFHERGFSEAECLRFFSLFFQLRRAFYFIKHSLHGKSNVMKRLRCSLWNCVFTSDIGFYDQYMLDHMQDFSTLIVGPTGSGKGLAAAAIGRSGFIQFNTSSKMFSENFKRNFISINLSQFPETLIESELFGYKKGAFTGANEDHDGVFSLCSPSGSLFIDEIGDASPQVQLKLLKVLQERTFTPVGSHKVQRFEGRVITATNQSIDELRRNGAFRDDFYYRLSSGVIQVPSLGQRIQDYPEELDDLVVILTEKIVGQRSKKLACDILKSLRKTIPDHYPWPGNVRELEQSIRSVLLTGEYGGDQLCIQPSVESWDGLIKAGKLTAKEILGRYCKALYKKHGSFGKVAEITELDRRTAKKYIEINFPDRQIQGMT